MKKLKIYFFLLFFLFFFLISFNLSLAQVGGDVNEVGENSPLSALRRIQGIVEGGLMPEIGNPVLRIVGIINYLLSFIGVLFLIIIIYGGVIWMTAAGNEEKVKNAKNLLKSALIGLVIIILSRVIYIFILERITQSV